MLAGHCREMAQGGGGLRTNAPEQAKWIKTSQLGLIGFLKKGMSLLTFFAVVKTQGKHNAFGSTV